jgi:anti-anti-sigma regulatory factor
MRDQGGSIHVLKITVHNGSLPATLKLEGKIAGQWVKELERVWHNITHKYAPRTVTVDLSGVTFVDAEGKRLLGGMLRDGAELTHAQLLTKYIIDGLRAGQLAQNKLEDQEPCIRPITWTSLTNAKAVR